MALNVGKLTQIKSRYKVIEDWQSETNEHKLVSNWYRHYAPNTIRIPSKVALLLFAYLYIYKSKFSKSYKGKHIKVVSESADGNSFELLNTSNSNPNDYDFRGQLIRMDLPLITYHNHVAFEVYFEKLPYKINKKATTDKDKEDKSTTSTSAYKANDQVLLKAMVMERPQSEHNDDLVRIQITNFDKFISMNMENDKSVIIELNKSQLIKSIDDGDGDAAEDEKSDFETDEENEENVDSDYDSADPRYSGFEQGDPFITAEYYFVGIISNKVDEFNTDTNNYHLDGFGIDSAKDWVYLGEGNNVVDSMGDEEDFEWDEPWGKPSILNLDVVRCEINMRAKTLTFYKNGEKIGPTKENHTISFDNYGVANKTWYPAICIVNKNERESSV